MIRIKLILPSSLCRESQDEKVSRFVQEASEKLLKKYGEQFARRYSIIYTLAQAMAMKRLAPNSSNTEMVKDLKADVKRQFEKYKKR